MTNPPPLQQQTNDTAFKAITGAVPDSMPLVDNAQADAYLFLHSMTGVGVSILATGAADTLAQGLFIAANKDDQMRQAIITAAGGLWKQPITDNVPNPAQLLEWGKVVIKEDVAVDPIETPPVADPLPTAPQETTDDLFGYMAITGPLENGNYWSRSLDETTEDKYTNWFSAIWNGTDLHLLFQMAKPVTAVVARELTYGEVSEWAISGTLSYAGNIPNSDLKDFTETGMSGQFLDVEDDAGLLITRLSPRQDYANKLASLVFNGKVVTSGALVDMRALFATTKPFSISGANGGVTFNYGEFACIAPLANPLANYKRPSTLRITMWTGAKGTASKTELVLGGLVVKVNV